MNAQDRLSLALSVGVLHSPLPPECAALVGTFSGEATVCGSGHTLKSDLERHGLRGDVIAINDAGIYVPCHHWVSCHADYATPWRELQKVRAHYGEPSRPDPILHGKQGGIWLPWPVSGKWAPLTGHLAPIVGLLLGYDKIALAGLPADNGGFFYPYFGNDFIHDQGFYLDAWRALHHEFFRGAVTSLSGNTKDILGAPCAS